VLLAAGAPCGAVGIDQQCDFVVDSVTIDSRRGNFPIGLAQSSLPECSLLSSYY